MNLKDLQMQIKNNNLDDLYVFLGDQHNIEKVYINKISQVKNMEILYVDSYKDIVNDLGSNNIFNTKNIYVILYDDEILKYEEVWKDIDTKGNIIIFKYIDIDKRSKFYKYFENKIVEFYNLSEDILMLHIKKIIPLNDNNCKQLIDICDGNYDRILIELDKLKHYNSSTPDIDFLELQKQNAFHKDIQDDIFDFINAFVTRNVDTVAKKLRHIKQQNSSCLGLLGLLYNNFRTILLIQNCHTSDISKTTGLTSQQIYYNKDKTGYYANHELISCLKTIYNLDKGIKTGKVEEDIALDYLVINVLY